MNGSFLPSSPADFQRGRKVGSLEGQEHVAGSGGEVPRATGSKAPSRDGLPCSGDLGEVTALAGRWGLHEVKVVVSTLSSLLPVWEGSRLAACAGTRGPRESLANCLLGARQDGKSVPAGWRGHIPVLLGRPGCRPSAVAGGSLAPPAASCRDTDRLSQQSTELRQDRNNLILFQRLRVFPPSRGKTPPQKNL